MSITVLTAIHTSLRVNIDTAVPDAPTTTTTTKPSVIDLGIKITTSYSSIESCDYPVGNKCLGADGKVMSNGVIACPRKYPLGTKFIVNGITYTCRDRTSLKYDGRFDIWQGYGYEAYKKALQWGFKKYHVYLIPD